MKKILALCGATSSGKTYIKDLLCNPDKDIKELVFHAPIQITTRPRRNGEPLSTYRYVTPEEYDEFESKGQLTAQTYFNGNSYGTLLSNFIVGKYAYNVILCSTEGLHNLKKRFKDDVTVSIETALVLSELNEKLINDHNRTLEFAKEEFVELAQLEYDYYIRNYSDNRATLNSILHDIDKWYM